MISKFATITLSASNSKIMDRVTFQRMVLCLAILCNSFILLGQTNTWTGASNALWSNPANWSLGIVPLATHDVQIPVTLFGSPQVDANAVCQSIIINASAMLTINNGVTLTVDGAVSDGILNSGTVINNGILEITNTGRHGFYNAVGAAQLINNGTLDIDGITSSGIYNRFGTITNSITGMVNIQNAGEHGFYSSGNATDSATIINDGIMNIGPNLGVRGIFQEQYSDFINNATGLLVIDGAPQHGALIRRFSTLTNYGVINISNSSNGITLVLNAAFYNQLGATVNIMDINNRGIYVNTSSDGYNYGEINISMANSGNGILLNNQLNPPTFTNYPTGTINIDNGASGVAVLGGDFSNEGQLFLGTNISSEAIYIPSLASSFVNEVGGELYGHGDVNVAYTFVNEGILIPGYDINGFFFQGEWNMTSTAIYMADIAGTNGPNVTSGNDQIQVLGNASPSDAILAGTLHISLINGFVPILGDAFILATFDGGYESTFDHVIYPAAPCGTVWNLEYNPNNVTLVLEEVGVSFLR